MSPHGDVLDIHVHGAVGEPFGGTVEGTLAAAAHHGGGVVASLVSGTSDEMARQVGVVAAAMTKGDPRSSAIRGIHCEGPFLSTVRRGAHDPHVLRDADPALVERLVGVAADAGGPGAIKHWTFAPERTSGGLAPFVRTLVEHGVVPAVGHTDAPAAQVRAALGLVADTLGAPGLVTHLFNGMPAFHHRSGGPVAAAMSAAAGGECLVEVIADGVHVAPEVVRMVFETLGPDRVVLVSDAMSATGLGDGDHLLGTLPVRVRDGVARLVVEEGEGSIAGSTSTLERCVRWAVDVAGVDEQDARTSATRTPAAALRL